MTYEINLVLMGKRDCLQDDTVGVEDLKEAHRIFDAAQDALYSSPKPRRKKSLTFSRIDGQTAYAVHDENGKYIGVVHDQIGRWGFVSDLGSCLVPEHLIEIGEFIGNLP